MQTSPRLRMSQKTKTKIGFAVAVGLVAVLLNIGLVLFSPPIPVVVLAWIVLVLGAAQVVNKSSIFFLRRKFATQAPIVSRSPDAPSRKQEKVRDSLILQEFRDGGSWVMQTSDRSNLLGTIVLMTSRDRSVNVCIFDGPVHCWSALTDGRTIVTTNLKEISTRADIIFHRVPRGDAAQVVGKHLSEIDGLAVEGIGLVTDDLTVDRRFEREERRSLVALGWLPEHLLVTS